MHTYLDTSIALDLAQQRRHDLESAARLHRLMRRAGSRDARRRSRDPGTGAAIIQMPAPPATVTSTAHVPTVCRVA